MNAPTVREGSPHPRSARVQTLSRAQVGEKGTEATVEYVVELRAADGKMRFAVPYLEDAADFVVGFMCLLIEHGLEDQFESAEIIRRELIPLEEVEAELGGGENGDA